MGYAGANPPQFTINMAYLWSRGPDDSLLRVGLREGSGVDIFELQERLRKVLPEKVGGWFRRELLPPGRRTRTRPTSASPTWSSPSSRAT